MDWAGGTEGRNHGISRTAERKQLRELLQIISPLVMMAGMLFFCLWTRSQIITIGYHSQQIASEEEALVRVQRRLVLEEQILNNPERLDAIARTDLGMIPLGVSQILPPVHSAADRGLQILALADLPRSPSPRRQSPTN